jgi:anti-sigma regulatory factor (Ser/Thr protein kinase)
MDEELRLTIPNDLRELVRVNAAANEILDRHGIGERTAYATNLALEELVSNVIRHGYPEGGRHDIELALRVTAAGIELRIEDDGRAFDPLKAPAPELHVPLAERKIGGLGIHLVRRFAREMRYERRGERNVLWVRI